MAKTYLLPFALLVQIFCLHAGVVVSEGIPELIPQQLHQYLTHPALNFKQIEDLPSLRGDSGDSELTCPHKKAIAPCVCVVGKKIGLVVSCAGKDVTQSSIDRVTPAIRAVNGLKSDEQLPIYFLSIFNTTLPSIDLTPFADTQIHFLGVIANAKLRAIVPPTETQEGSIDANILFVAVSPLTDAGLGNGLKMFSPSMKYLWISHTQLEGSRYSVGKSDETPGEVEFLPGLARLTNLYFIYLGGNRIKKVGGGDFARNVNLWALGLGDDITTIEQDAFRINANYDDSTGGKNITVFLAKNPVKDDSFRSLPRNGLFNKDRKIILDLSMTGFDYLSAGNFEDFLDDPNQNQIRLLNNKLDCDGRMSWLKAGRESYEPRVFNATCEDGQSVFESSLIP